MEMVRIEGGTFTMGSPDDEPGREDYEGPQHQVTVSSFYMGKYPVTQEEYQAVMGVNPSYFKGDNLPVEQVSWYDAVEYCNRLSQREGLKAAYTVKGKKVTWNRKSNGYRLPTEAEWEYACRAGTTTPYNSGTSVDNAGWYYDNSGGRTHPVGEKQPNAWGLYDMHGRDAAGVGSLRPGSCVPRTGSSATRPTGTAASVFASFAPSLGEVVSG